MGRRYKGQLLHGWLNLDKPPGLSSSQTGILPIAFGEATKTVTYAMDGMKAYQFGVRWGEARSTDDREGNIIETHYHRPTALQIEGTMAAFVGTIEQVPPRFSAVKVGGRRAYDLARRNKAVELKPRRVEVQELRLVDVPDADSAVLSVTCGKGTYVRALARDLAHRLGTVGYVDWLRRTMVGPFIEADAISLDKIETLGHIPPDPSLLKPIETVLDDIPALALSAQEAQKLKHGQSISALSVASRSPFKDIEQGDTVCAMSKGRLVALVRIADGGIHPVRVMNL